MKHKRIKILLAAALCAAVSASVPAVATGYLATSVVNLNSAPVAENLEFETYRGVTLAGELRSADPEADEVCYSVTKEPNKGSVTLEGASFTYTPAEGKRGKDTFKYVAVDSFGNVSNEATVTVSIKKQQTKVTYSDLKGSDVEYAATYLAEEGIFVGEKLGSEYLFDPGAPVSRGEFLAMCLCVAGADVDNGAVMTGFSDDGDIPLWQKPYVAAAVIGNVVNGSRDKEGRIVFSPNRAVTRAEAAVMLNNALGITNVSLSYSDSVPAWASQAAVNLESVNVFSVGDGKEALTRAEAAKMLAEASKLAARETRSGLLAWAK